jgi:hypothetical protein
MTSEVDAYKALRDGIRRRGDRMHRMESLVSFGFPDVNACLGGVEVWIEIKKPNEPKRDSTPLFGSNHKLLVSQMNWFLAQKNAGGYAYIYIDTGNNRLLIGAEYSDDLNRMTLNELLKVSIWKSAIPTGKDSWNQLRSELRKNRTVLSE